MDGTSTRPTRESTVERTAGAPIRRAAERRRGAIDGRLIALIAATVAAIAVVAGLS